MKFIATDVNDTPERLQNMVSMQKDKPGFAIDNYFYRSHIAYQQEMDKIVYKIWLYAGHVSQVAKQGDYFLFDVGEDSIIITRDMNDQVQGMFNICRHRGARVCEEQEGSRKTFVCPYHGWTYGTDGKLLGARDMELLEGFTCGDYGLKKVQVSAFQGLIFINCDREAEDFLPALNNVTTPLSAYDLENAKVAHRQTYVVDANWKLALENYLECYHCATSHRAYARIHTLKDLECNVAVVNEAMYERSEALTGVVGLTEEYDPNGSFTQAKPFGHSVYHSRYALYDGYVTGSQDGKPVAPLMGKFKGYDGGAGDFNLGPLAFMLNYPDHCVLYRFIPRSLTQTDMEIVWYVRADAEEGKDYDKEQLTWLWHHTTLEDEYIITRNSEGVNSRFFEPGPYHPEFEATSMDFIQWYLEALSR